MADPRDRDELLTRAGRAAKRSRANALKGDRQARADLAARWSPALRNDGSGVSTLTDAERASGRP